MMEFMVEILITVFAFGGIIGAVVALHLSANLKETENVHNPAPATLELPRNDEPAELKSVPVNSVSRRAADDNRRHR